MKTHALRGMLRAARKDCAAALNDFRAAERIDLGPSTVAAYNRYNIQSWIGQSLNGLGRHAEAQTIYASLLGPEHSEADIGPALMAYARLGYAESLRQGGQATEAEAEFLSALLQIETGIGDIDPLTTGQALVMVGNFYADIGRCDTARINLQKGRDLLFSVGEQQEKGLDAQRALGVIDYSTGQLQQAIEQLSAAHAGFIAVFGATSPDAKGAGYWLAIASADAGRVDEAADLSAQLHPRSIAHFARRRQLERPPRRVARQDHDPPRPCGRRQLAADNLHRAAGARQHAVMDDRISEPAVNRPQAC